MAKGVSAKLGSIGNHVFNGLRYLFELFASGVYRMMLERTTIQPLREIINVPPGNQDTQRTLLRQWAQIKAHECQYIQLAVYLEILSLMCLESSLTALLGRLSLHDSGLLSAMARYSQRPLVSFSTVLRKYPDFNCRCRDGLATTSGTTRSLVRLSQRESRCCIHSLTTKCTTTLEQIGQST